MDRRDTLGLSESDSSSDDVSNHRTTTASTRMNDANHTITTDTAQSLIPDTNSHSRRASSSKGYVTRDEAAPSLNLNCLRRSASFAKDNLSCFFFASLSAIVGWSCVCAWGADALNDEADLYPDGRAASWLSWIDNTKTAIGVLGGLFTFSLVFRFNQCYVRWWEGRVIWGHIIKTSLNFAQKNHLWIVDTDYANRISRLIIVFAYACKAQLRNKSLGDPEESGEGLIERGLLTRAELTDMETYPCWQPHYMIDLIRTIIAKAMLKEGALIFSMKHPVAKETFKFLEQSLYDFATQIGDAIRVRSAGLPRSYDAMHFIFFYIYFAVAPISWAPSMGWAMPPLVSFVACIIMALISMGTSLVDPFGTDIVDLPLESFCMTIELQVGEIIKRSQRAEKMVFAETSKAIVPKTKTGRMPKLPMHSFQVSHRINLKG